MKIRKKNNSLARIAKLSRALLRLETIGVISLSSGHQLVCDIKHGCLVQPSPHVTNALLDLPHKWTIYIAVFMRLESGKITYKPVELYIDNQYKFNDLEEVIRSEYSKLINSCNSLRIIGSGFIANPNQISLTEDRAAILFEKATVLAAIEDEKTKKVIDIEARTGKTIQELLFLCVERDYTLKKAAKYIGVRDSKTVITLINRFAPILSDHKFRHGNEVSGKKRIAHMRAMNAASNKKKCILINGFLMTRKEHCKRLNVKYTTFSSRKRAGLSDIEALGIDMTWKTHGCLAYEQRHSEKIIELNAKGLPAKTISYRFGIPLKTTYRVLSKLKNDIEGSGFIDAHEAKKIIGVCESALRGRINNHENFPSYIRVGRKRYWKREDIENYANN